MEDKNIRKVTVVERNGEVVSRTVENNGNDINSNFENNIESNIAIQNPKHIFIILGAVMLLIGIAMGIYGVFNAKSVSLKEETYIPIEAKVVDYEERIERTEDEDGYVTTEHTYRDCNTICVCWIFRYLWNISIIRWNKKINKVGCFTSYFFLLYSN